MPRLRRIPETDSDGHIRPPTGLARLAAQAQVRMLDRLATFAAVAGDTARDDIGPIGLST